MPKSLQPFLKSVTPAILTLVGALVNGLASGFDVGTLKLAVGGLILSAVAFFVPNLQPAAVRKPPA